MWNLKNKTNMHKTKQKRFTNIMNKLVVSSVERAGVEGAG